MVPLLLTHAANVIFLLIKFVFYCLFLVCSFGSCRHFSVPFIFASSGTCSVVFEFCAYVTSYVRMFVLFYFVSGF